MTNDAKCYEELYQKLSKTSATSIEAIYAEAIKVGYLIYPSKEALLARQNTQIHKDLHEIFYLNVSQWHIIEIGDISLCTNIRILDVSNNYLTRIDALSQCIHLIKLDLHHNRISMLPDVHFWSMFKQLKIVYLHNNPLIRLENIRRLGACSALEILTLNDTPLSLKKNYRHHVVNIIYSLKALDNYIISDEEIIEEAQFKNRFSALTHVFRRDLFIKCQPNNTYAQELSAIHRLIASINYTLAHSSPVQIIQKNIRAHLDRKFFRFYYDSLLWSTIKIQRWWRAKKSLKYNDKKLFKGNHLNSSSFHTMSFNDEQTYSRKRFITNTPSSNVFTHQPSNIIIDLTKLNRSSSLLDNMTNAYGNSGGGGGGGTGGGFEIDEIDERSKSTTLQLNREMSPLRKKSSLKATHQLKPLNSRKSKKSLKEIDFELGRMLSNLESTRIVQSFKVLKPIRGEVDHVDDDDHQEKEEDDDYLMPYRLSKQIKIKSLNNYVADLINEKKFYHYSVQQLELDAHRRLYEAAHDLKEPLVKETFKTNDQRLFQKLFGTITLGCLRAVDKAYFDRHTNEKKQKKHQLVRETKKDREFNAKQLDYFKEERLKSIQMKHEKEKLHLTIAKRRVDLKPIQNKEFVQEMRFKAKNVHIDRQNDILFAREFNKQHLSVSKALQKHELNMRQEELLRMKAKFIQTQKEYALEQQDLVRNYLRQRSLLRVAKSNNDRDALDKSLMKYYESKSEQAKQRVIKLKSSNRQLRESVLDEDTANSKCDDTIHKLTLKNERRHKSGHESIKVRLIDSAALLLTNENTNMNSSLSDYYTKRLKMPLQS